MFTLQIELGNDAMRGPRDVARALETVAKRLRTQCLDRKVADQGRILDDNGNSVGQWSYAPED